MHIRLRIGCEDFRLSQTDAGTGIMRIKLKNQVGEPIVISDWNLTNDAVIPLSCSQEPPLVPFKSGEIKDFEFTGCDIQGAGFIVGEKNKVKLKVSYYKAMSSQAFTYDVYGEVYSTVTKVFGLISQGVCNDDTDNDNNGCWDYDGGDTGCSSPSDTTESGTCPQNGGAGMPLYCYVSTCLLMLLYSRWAGSIILMQASKPAKLWL